MTLLEQLEQQINAKNYNEVSGQLTEIREEFLNPESDVDYENESKALLGKYARELLLQEKFELVKEIFDIAFDFFVETQKLEVNFCPPFLLAFCGFTDTQSNEMITAITTTIDSFKLEFGTEIPSANSLDRKRSLHTNMSYTANLCVAAPKHKAFFLEVFSIQFYHYLCIKNKIEAAELVYERILKMTNANLNPDHYPRLLNCSKELFRMEKYKEAEAITNLNIKVINSKTHLPQLVMQYFYLACCCYKQRKYPQTIAAIENIFKPAEDLKNIDPTFPRLFHDFRLALIQLPQVRSNLGLKKQLLNMTIKFLEMQPLPDKQLLASCLVDRAEDLMHEKNPIEARGDYRRALSTYLGYVKDNNEAVTPNTPNPDDLLPTVFLKLSSTYLTFSIEHHFFKGIAQMLSDHTNATTNDSITDFKLHYETIVKQPVSAESISLQRSLIEFMEFVIDEHKKKRLHSNSPIKKYLDQEENLKTFTLMKVTLEQSHQSVKSLQSTIMDSIDFRIGMSTLMSTFNNQIKELAENNKALKQELTETKKILHELLNNVNEPHLAKKVKVKEPDLTFFQSPKPK